MSTIKRGITVIAGAWAKHLRPWGRRAFWKRQRAQDRRDIIKDYRSIGVPMFVTRERDEKNS